MNDSMRDKDFLALSNLLQRHTGIQLPRSKRAMIEGRLRKHARSLGIARLDDYGKRLFERGLIDEEFTTLVDLTTTNKTDFFREPDHFEFLRDQAIPSLLALRSRGDTQVKVWSAACSIGAEAYTAAIVLAAMQDARADFHFSILGTDISTNVLDQARLAIYPAAMMAPVPPDLRKRYVMDARDPSREESRIAPGLRRHVTFRHLNLMDASYPFTRDFDVIFCRNVLIYFAHDTQRAVLRRLIEHLRTGGFLILGHSESSAVDGSLALKQVLPTVFRRDAPQSTTRNAA